MKSYLSKRRAIFLLFSLITVNLFPQTFVDSGISLPQLSNCSITWGDYDRDGDLDILMAGDSIGINITRIIRNNDISGFSLQYQIKNLTGVKNGSVAWGDYDNDGDLDILLTGIYTGESYTSKIYSNNGNNTFTEQTGIVLPGLGYSTVAWSDYDNDGDLDISFGGSSYAGAYPKIFRNNGNNSFTGQSNIILPSAIRGSMSWGDYDNDGDLDLLVTGNASGSAKIFRNNGDNSFTEQTGISLTGVWYSSAVWGDYDYDGDLDILLCGETSSGRISKIYRNNGNNSFTVQSGISLTAVSHGSVAWGDYDNDGDLDILLAGASGAEPNYNPVSKIYRNNGDNTFTEQSGIALTGIYDGCAAWGDYDNDGDLDILLSGLNSTGQRVVKIYTNKTVTPNTKPVIPANLRSAINNNTVTFTWDKSSDTETSQNGLSYNLYIYEKGQSFYKCPPHAFKQTETLNGRRLIAKLGSIQWRTAGYTINDLTPNKTYYWSVQALDAGLQGGNFSTEQSFLMPLYRPVNQANCISFSNMQATQVTASWANGGGTKRVAFIKAATSGSADPVDITAYAVNSVTPGGWRCVYNGTGNSFLLSGLVPNTSYLLHVCEYNGDPGYEQYLKSVTYQNPGSLNTVFTEQTAITLAALYSGSLLWGDYDNDSFLDIFITGSTDGSRIYRNNGNNTFTKQTSLTLPRVSHGSLALADYDNDGKLDFLLTGTLTGAPSDAITKIYRNNWNNTFTEQTGILLPGVMNSSVAWIDYDNDGDQDILLTGSSGSGIISEIYRNNRDNTFTKQPGLGLSAVYNSSIAVADYDNDGDQDIMLTGNDGSRRISKIYRNNGNNTFSEQTDIALTGIDMGYVSWGDYDNDGNQDILLTGATGDSPNYNPVSKIYHNNGNNSFTEQTGIMLTGVLWSSTAWIDYDNDGDLDILLTGYSGSDYFCKLYINNGGNNFTEHPGNSLPGISTGSIATGDYDNDGDLDILLGGNSSASTITKIYRNEILNKNIKPSAPAGLQSNWNGDCLIFKWKKASDNNTPSKALKYNIRISTSSGGNEIRSAQALSDGKLLLAEMNNLVNDTNIVFKLPLSRYYWSVQAVDKGMYASTFAGEMTTPTDSIQAKNLNAYIKSSNSLLIRWSNGNGMRRALFGRYSSSSARAKPINGIIYNSDSYFGQGDKIQSTQWYCLYNGKADSVAIYGIEQGYSYDIQVVEYIEVNGLPRYFSTTGNANPGIFSSSLFSEQTNISLAPVTGSSVAWGDYDNDGYLDILLTGSNFISKVYHNNGDNSFTDQTGIVLTGVEYGSVAWGDYDNDGDLDILLTGDAESGLISKIYRNMGNNTFAEQTGITLTGIWDGSAAWGDYDNDGDLDIIITGMADGNQYVTKIYRNNGDNTFTENTASYLQGLYYSSVAWGDYDNDGDLDFILMGAAGYKSDFNRIYRNNGDGTFTPQTGINLTGAPLGDITWGDYDNDGDLDILLTGNVNAVPTTKIYRNDGKNIFTWQSDIVLTGVDESSVAWGDYDNDGYLDILLTGSIHSNQYVAKIYHNNWNNSFTEQANIGLKGVYRSSVAWGDYDNDGDLDILVSGSTGSGKISSIYRNNTFMMAGNYLANKKPVGPVNLSDIRQPDGIRLSWSPVKNDETSSKTMTYNVRVGTSKGNSNIVSSQANSVTGYRTIPDIGNAQLDTTYFIRTIPSGKFYWSVQAVDQGFRGGAWSAVDSFIVKNTQAFFKADTVCLGLPTHFTDQSVATDGIASWKWDFKDGTISSSQNPVHTFSTYGIHNVKLVIRSNAGVRDSLEKNIVVKPKPVTDFSASIACQGTETVLTNLTNTSGLNITFWSWDYGDGKGSTFQNPGSHGYLTAGDYQLTLTATADNGCAGTVIKTVSVGAYPVAVITANAPLSFCAGDSVTLSVATNPQYSYRWMLNNTGITNAITNNYTAKLSGNYSVEVTNTKGFCKTTSSQVTVTKLVKPVTPVIVTQNYQVGKCPGANQIVLSVDQPVIEYGYQWKRNGTPVSNATGSNYFGFLSAGDYSVTVSQSGCKTESAIKTIVYDNAPPKPLIYVHGPNVWYLACSIADAAQYKYKWYYNENLIPGADKYIYVANKNPGNYYVTIENNKGCYTSSDVVKIPTGGISIEETDPFAGLKIYPNPSSGQFTVEIDNRAYGEFVISVSAQGGRQVLSTKFEKTTDHFSSRIDLNGQAKGMYIINFKTDRYLVTRKLVVE